jgi:predicted MFS family arabinose efflux permease
VSHASFAGLIAAHGLLGAYIASANFFRFAAVDGLDGANKARAMSWVVAGGVLAALVGPWIASHLRGVAGYAEFSLCYAVLALIGVATILIMVAWRPTHAHSIARQKNRTTAHAGQGIDRWLVGTAIFASAGGYFVMNLLMVQASLVLRDICSFDQTASAIQWHVLAMFAPSFLTGALIERWGLRAILALGALLLSSAALIGLIEPSYATVAAGLLVLGLGWNLAYVGGGAMLARFVPEHLRHHWQGVNDTLIAVCATLGAFAPAPMLAALGWEWTNASCLALTAAMGLICWFILPSEERQRGIEVTNVVSK